MTALQALHQGYKVTGMVGHMTAEIREVKAALTYVEIVIDDDGHRRSYDLNGLTDLIEDLRHVLRLAEQVEDNNVRNREIN